MPAEKLETGETLSFQSKSTFKQGVLTDSQIVKVKSRLEGYLKRVYECH